MTSHLASTSLGLEDLDDRALGIRALAKDSDRWGDTTEDVENVDL